jgi:hypothetical protein
MGQLHDLMWFRSYGTNIVTGRKVGAIAVGHIADCGNGRGQTDERR